MLLKALNNSDERMPEVRCIFYADRHASFRRFESVDFDAFTHFSQLANVCFGVAMK